MTSPASQNVVPPSGFDDYVGDANAVFRTCLEAMSHPGRIVPLTASLSAPAPLLPGAAAVLLALADYETECWLDCTLGTSDEVSSFLRFHTGSRFAGAPNQADFAIIADVAEMPELLAFKKGTPEFPDRSTTVIMQVEQLQTEGLRFTGPGIDGETRFSCQPMPINFEVQLRNNRALFPCGVDLIFVSPTEIAALPRSVSLVGEA